VVFDPICFPLAHSLLQRGVFVTASFDRVSEIGVLVGNLDLFVKSILFELQLLYPVLHQLRLDQLLPQVQFLLKFA